MVTHHPKDRLLAALDRVVDAHAQIAAESTDKADRHYESSAAHKAAQAESGPGTEAN